jgi:hypothetical protein
MTDAEILDYATDRTLEYSRYQAEHFVIDSHITDYKRVKQLLLEIDSRGHTIKTLELETQKDLANIDLIKEHIDAEESPAQIRIFELDIDRLKIDNRYNIRNFKQAKAELQTYIDCLRDLVPDLNINDLKSIEHDEELERDYWVSRMAKQAAMDLAATGRIGVGNMDSIAMMPEVDQIKTLATTLQYSEKLGLAMGQISEAVSQGLLANTKDLPKFDVPNITDKLMMTDNEDIQLAAQPKTKSESI